MHECGICGKLMAALLMVSCVYGQQQDGQKVSVKWGVVDSTATVGKLFRMHIPSDAFSGRVLSYRVQSSGGSPLPNWVEFDAKDNVLQGIPTPSDADTLYLEIIAQGPVNQATVTSTVYVRNVPSHTSGVPLRVKPSGPEFVQCKEKEPETVATLILDVNLESLTTPERLALLNKFTSHMELHEEMVKVLPVGNSPLHDSSALVSGAGDSLSPKTSGLFISWPVGCGKVKEGHFSVLQRLDDDSGSGRMAKVLGRSVIGWQVTNSHFQAPTRKRRQVHATNTPAVTPIVPTKTDTQPEKTDDTEGKMTHQVVVTQSPTFIHPTATQPSTSKTDDVVLPPVYVGKEDKSTKVMPAATMTKVMPVTKTKEMPAIKPTRTHDISEPTDVPTVDADCVDGMRPEVEFPIQMQAYQVGEVIEYFIPEDTFKDCEVGGTRGLELMLFKDVSDVIKPDFFLQFDAGKQKIVGLAMEKDVGKHQFNLIAKKKSNEMMANDEFTLHIKNMRKRNINHELSVTVDLNYDKFMSNVTDRINLANKVASVYGDPDASKLTVTKIKPGSVIYGWTNSSLASRDCPAEEVTDLVRKLVNADGTLNSNAIEKLKPYTLLSAEAQPAGACKGNPMFPSVVSRPEIHTMPEVEDKGAEVEDKDGKSGMVTTKKPTDEPEVDEGEADEEEVEKVTVKTDTTTTPDDVAKGAKGGDDEDDIWITTVVPAVVIVVILLIALLIACILYRKKRKGKMNVEEQNTFINKGAPVIFPDELEDRPSDVNKPLLLEGSTAPPPVYHRGATESPEPQMSGSHRNNKNNLNLSPASDSITEMPEKPYEPPPPFTASSNSKQPRTTHPQQPYSQPPQILP